MLHTLSVLIQALELTEPQPEHATLGRNEGVKFEYWHRLNSVLTCSSRSWCHSPMKHSKLVEGTFLARWQNKDGYKQRQTKYEGPH